MGLKNKLDLYEKKAISPAEKGSFFSLEHIGGEKVTTESGGIWRVEKRLGVSDDFFGIKISEAVRGIGPLLSCCGIAPDTGISDMLFFDLETTSLSIGAGNYPFLCGFGFFDDDDFVTEQIFMEKYSDEPAILKYMLSIFQGFKYIVTFNGRSFDVPLIKSRYMINRVYGYPVKMPVFDLIVPARRVFRSVYENCSLQTLERNLLGIERVGDVPGWMIPEIYFNFQKNGDPSRLPAVIEHNRIDIVSMAFLSFFLADIFESVEKKEYSSLDERCLRNIARFLHKMDTAAFLDLAEYMGESLFEDESVFREYTRELKRRTDWEKVLSYWEKSRSLFSLEELSKYYEHIEKDRGRALSFCNEAMSLIEGSIYSPGGDKLSDRAKSSYSQKFEKRKKRLELNL